MRFKVGDKVKVRKGLKVGKRYGTDIFNKQMRKYRGKIMTVKEINYENKTYNLRGDPIWNWTDKMLYKKALKK